MTEYETDYSGRVEELASRYVEDSEEFDPWADEVPREEEAMEYLREGFGQAVWLYVEGRTGGRIVAFTEEEYSKLEEAMNGWLELYARCYGEDIDANHTLREAGKALLDTRNVKDTAQVLTKIP